MSLTYFAPSNLSEALSYMSQHRVKVIAGGTDLLVKYYEKFDSLDGLMDIGRLEEMKSLVIGESVHIGALITHQEIADHSWLRENLSALADGAGEVGAPQIRNRGTLGGNLVNASPAADTAPPLVVLGAHVEIAAAGAVQSIPIEEFFTGPGRTVLQPDQLVTGVTLQKPRANQGSAYIKLGKRKAMAIATASIAVHVAVEDGKLADIRICMGSVAPIPLRAKKTEDILRGQELKALPVSEAQAQLISEITPIDDIRGTAEYRRQAAEVIFRRALHKAILNAGVELDG